jgi:hypothetical protein
LAAIPLRATKGSGGAPPDLTATLAKDFPTASESPRAPRPRTGLLLARTDARADIHERGARLFRSGGAFFDMEELK